TFTALTSFCALNVFSIPVAQKPQTIPLTVALIVSAETAAARLNVIAIVSRYFFIVFPPLKLNLPVEHDVFVTLVTDLEEIGFVEKTNQRRRYEVIVFRRMM